MEPKPIQIDFTSRDLRRLIVPLVIEQLLAITVGLLDSVMVSQVGEAAISAVSLVDTVNVLLVNAFAALAARPLPGSTWAAGSGTRPDTPGPSSCSSWPRRPWPSWPSSTWGGALC